MSSSSSRRSSKSRPRSYTDQGSKLPTSEVKTSQATAAIRRDGSLATLLLDGIESSCLDLQDATHLEFEYMQHMDILAAAAFPPSQPLRALHLGAAGCALPRTWNVKWPNSRQVAVDNDEKLMELVRDWFDLPRSPHLRLRVGDAREIVTALQPESWDVVVRDVFTLAKTPPSLCTVEFSQQIDSILRPNGIYIANIAGGGMGTSLKQELVSISQVFPHLIVVADQKVIRGARRGNVVVASSKIPLDQMYIERELRRLPLPARVIEGSQLSSLLQAQPLHDPEISS